MARTNGIDTMSYAELLSLQEKISAAISERKSEDARATKDQLRAMAEKPVSTLKSCSAVSAAKARARPSSATRKMLRRPGQGAAASRTGWLMP